MKKAETLKLGCSYVEHEVFYVDGTSRPSDTPKCENKPCAYVPAPESSAMSIGGSVVGSSKYHVNEEEFVGTCGDRTPIQCDDYPADDSCSQCAAERCCRSTFLCDHDPNCGAIIDCINACAKEDDACAVRCADAGDSIAITNLSDAISCLTSLCADSCKN